MENEKILVRISERLQKLGLSYDLMTPSVQKYLLKIETEVDRRMTELEEASVKIGSNRVNINTIARSGVIANKTVYKYDVLIQYIKLCEEEYNSCMPGGKEIEQKLRRKLRETSEMIRKMDLQTVDVELLKAEVEHLKQNAKDDAVKLSILAEENLRLSNEIQAMRKEHPELFDKRKSTVVAMPGITLK